MIRPMRHAYLQMLSHCIRSSQGYFWIDSCWRMISDWWLFRMLISRNGTDKLSGYQNQRRNWNSGERVVLRYLKDFLLYDRKPGFYYRWGRVGADKGRPPAGVHLYKSRFPRIIFEFVYGDLLRNWMAMCQEFLYLVYCLQPEKQRPCHHYYYRYLNETPEEMEQVLVRLETKTYAMSGVNFDAMCLT